MSYLPGIEIVLPQSGFPTPRRRWARFKVAVPIRVVTRRRGEVAIVEGVGAELNYGGMTVTLNPTNVASAPDAADTIELYICEHVTVEFALPDSGRSITVKCIVRNRRRHTYGFEFIPHSEAGHEGPTLIESVLHCLSIC